MKKGLKVLLVVDNLRLVAQKIQFELLTNEEQEQVVTHYGESEHLFSIVRNVYRRPSRWFKPGEESAWDRRVNREVDEAFKKDRRNVIVEMPEGHYHAQPLTYRGKNVRK